MNNRVKADLAKMIPTKKYYDDRTADGNDPKFFTMGNSYVMYSAAVKKLKDLVAPWLPELIDKRIEAYMQIPTNRFVITLVPDVGSIVYQITTAQGIVWRDRVGGTMIRENVKLFAIKTEINGKPKLVIMLPRESGYGKLKIAS